MIKSDGAGISFGLHARREAIGGLTVKDAQTKTMLLFGKSAPSALPHAPKPNEKRKLDCDRELRGCERSYLR